MAHRNQKHLSLQMRKIIEEGLKNETSKRTIAKVLNKDPSTICKEVKKHRFLYKRKYNNSSRGLKDCLYLDACGLKICMNPCLEYSMIPCKRRDQSVGVCNGCSKFIHCSLSKYRYDADKAHHQYSQTLTDSRVGVNLTTSQAKKMGELIKPLIDQGQSPYTIVQNHSKELDICEKTLYNYIRDGVFSINGLIDLDLRVKPTRKYKVKRIYSKPREDRKYLKNRTYDDFLKFTASHPSQMVVEMDTIYNDRESGPCIQTFQFVKYHFMIGILHPQKTANNMTAGIVALKNSLGSDYFKQFMPILLTDRGSEFNQADKIEETGCAIFYCDAMASWQKPHVENNHKYLRYIVTKDRSFEQLGLDYQVDLDLTFSHINSFKRQQLENKSPFEVLIFYNPNALEILEKLNLKEIDSDSIILNPSLLKK